MSVRVCVNVCFDVDPRRCQIYIILMRLIKKKWRNEAGIDTFTAIFYDRLRNFNSMNWKKSSSRMQLWILIFNFCLKFKMWTYCYYTLICSENVTQWIKMLVQQIVTWQSLVQSMAQVMKNKNLILWFSGREKMTRMNEFCRIIKDIFSHGRQNKNNSPGLNKVSGSKILWWDGYQLQWTPKECQRVHQPKYCVSNDQDKDIHPDKSVYYNISLDTKLPFNMVFLTFFPIFKMSEKKMLKQLLI